jgi:hypothetical protein
MSYPSEKKVEAGGLPRNVSDTIKRVVLELLQEGGECAVSRALELRGIVQAAHCVNKLMVGSERSDDIVDTLQVLLENANLLSVGVVVRVADILHKQDCKEQVFEFVSAYLDSNSCKQFSMSDRELLMKCCLRAAEFRVLAKWVVYDLEKNGATFLLEQAALSSRIRNAAFSNKKAELVLITNALLKRSDKEILKLGVRWSMLVPSLMMIGEIRLVVRFLEVVRRALPKYGTEVFLEGHLNVLFCFCVNYYCTMHRYRDAHAAAAAFAPWVSDALKQRVLLWLELTSDEMRISSKIPASILGSDAINDQYLVWHALCQDLNSGKDLHLAEKLYGVMSRESSTDWNIYTDLVFYYWASGKDEQALTICSTGAHACSRPEAFFDLLEIAITAQGLGRESLILLAEKLKNKSKNQFLFWTPYRMWLVLAASIIFSKLGLHEECCALMDGNFDVSRECDPQQIDMLCQEYNDCLLQQDFWKKCFDSCTGYASEHTFWNMICSESLWKFAQLVSVEGAL